MHLSIHSVKFFGQNQLLGRDIPLQSVSSRLACSGSPYLAKANLQKRQVPVDTRLKYDDLTNWPCLPFVNSFMLPPGCLGHSCALAEVPHAIWDVEQCGCRPVAACCVADTALDRY